MKPIYCKILHGNEKWETNNYQIFSFSFLLYIYTWFISQNKEATWFSLYPIHVPVDAVHIFQQVASVLFSHHDSQATKDDKKASKQASGNSCNYLKIMMADIIASLSLYR